MEKIKYKNLSTPLKIAVIISLINGVIWVLSFLIGFIEGLLGI